MDLLASNVFNLQMQRPKHRTVNDKKVISRLGRKKVEANLESIACLTRYEVSFSSLHNIDDKSAMSTAFSFPRNFP
jgi:hypothetical protein